MAWFRRMTEATTNALVASGSLPGWGVDPIDGDTGYRRLGESGRQIPYWTLEKARAYSVHAYRANPMGRAILDTYVSFCVGDSGVRTQVSDPQVREVVERFWNDPKNKLGLLQEPLLRDHLLMGETALEMMVGEMTGLCRFSLIDPSRIEHVDLLNGNPLWHRAIQVRQVDQQGNVAPMELSVVQVDDLSDLRSGQVQFWPSFRALITDRRGVPFLAPILDDLQNYDDVLSNLIDRTALMRYFAVDVELKGASQTEIDAWVANRGGLHVPPAGSVEVHNDSVKFTPVTATVGAQEDVSTAKAILTNVAGGAGLSKHWLAEPEDANKATAGSMAEPVRRRVGNVQNMWLGYMTELCRYAVDQAVTVGRLPAFVPQEQPGGGEQRMVPVAETVRVVGPEIAAADASITATVLESLAKSLTGAVVAKITSPEAARMAWNKAWEQFVGIPYTADLDPMKAGVDDLAGELDGAAPAAVTLKLA